MWMDCLGINYFNLLKPMNLINSKPLLFNWTSAEGESSPGIVKAI